MLWDYRHFSILPDHTIIPYYFVLILWFIRSNIYSLRYLLRGVVDGTLLPYLITLFYHLSLTRLSVCFGWIHSATAAPGGVAATST